MKNFSKIVLLIAMVTLVVCAGTVTVFAIPSVQEVQPYSLNISYENGVKKVIVERNLVSNRNYVNRGSDFYMEELNASGAQKIILQVESFNFDEEEQIVERVDLAAVSNNASSTWGSSDGDVTIVTAAYLLGYNSNSNPIYKAYGEIYMNRNFAYHNEDRMIIRHGANAVYQNNYIDTTGVLSYHAVENLAIPYVPGKRINEDVSKSIVGNFSSINGIDYKFTTPANYNKNTTGYGITYINNGTYTNRCMKGQYAFIATQDTCMQVCYVYNKHSITTSLSLNIGPVGVGIDVSGSYQLYSAEPLTITRA